MYVDDHVENDDDDKKARVSRHSREVGWTRLDSPPKGKDKLEKWGG